MIKIFIYVFIFILARCRVITYTEGAEVDVKEDVKLYNKPKKNHIGRSINSGFRGSKGIIGFFEEIDRGLRKINKIESQYQSVIGNFDNARKEIKKRLKVEKDIREIEEYTKDGTIDGHIDGHYHHHHYPQDNFVDEPRIKDLY